MRSLTLSDQTTICTFRAWPASCPCEAKQSWNQIRFPRFIWYGISKKGPHILEAADNKVVFSLTFLCRDLQKKKNPNGKKCQKKCYYGAKIDKCIHVVWKSLWTSYQEYVSCVIWHEKSDWSCLVLNYLFLLCDDHISCKCTKSWLKSRRTRGE